jgi:hypothetical protein
MKWTIEFYGREGGYVFYELHPGRGPMLMSECLDYILEYGHPGDVIDENGVEYPYEELVESRRLDEELLD